MLACKMSTEIATSLEHYSFGDCKYGHKSIHTIKSNETHYQFHHRNTLYTGTKPAFMTKDTEVSDIN